MDEAGGLQLNEDQLLHYLRMQQRESYAHSYEQSMEQSLPRSSYESGANLADTSRVKKDVDTVVRQSPSQGTEVKQMGVADRTTAQVTLQADLVAPVKQSTAETVEENSSYPSNKEIIRDQVSPVTRDAVMSLSDFAAQLNPAKPQIQSVSSELVSVESGANQVAESSTSKRKGPPESGSVQLRSRLRGQASSRKDH